MPHYNIIRENDPLAPTRRNPAAARVREFIDASGMQGRQFTDTEAAARMGLAGLIVPGPMKFAYLQQYLSNWIGSDGTLRRLRVAYHRPDLQDTELTICAHIIRKYKENDERRIDIDLFIENTQGERSLHGTATIAFP